MKARKYRDVLHDDGARAEIAAAAERTVLGGFAAHTIFYNHLTASDLDEQTVWARLLRRISSCYNEANDTLVRSQNEVPTEEDYVATLTVLVADRGLSPLVEAFERYGILKSRRLLRFRNARPMTYAALFLGAGVALRLSIDEDADDTFGAGFSTEPFSVQALEDYREPRKMRDV